MSLEVDIEKKFKGFHLQSQFTAGDETMGLLGASGCGKSLTMRSIAGIERPDAGKIVVNGTVFFDRAPGKKARVDLTPQQRKTALLFQNYMLFPNLTVAQNVAAGISKDVSPADRDAMVQTELKRFGLSGFEKRYPVQLSGGQQQRVALARMLAARPGILMLDEPFSALDAHLKSVLEQNLVSLFDAFRGTILYVSHDIDEALRFCDRIAVVEAGHIMEMGTGEDLVNRPQSQAGIKLSGCKNATPVERVDARRVWLPKWGVEVETAADVPEGVKCLGVRAFFLERADGPGRNCFRMRVDRVSDSRFERTVLLGFCDRSEKAAPAVERTEDEMKYLHQHLFWRVDKLKVDAAHLPHEGEEVWIRIPDDKLYLVEK
ncbi:sulfate/molybdate ABC transporter ATP-binding protein [uncultured Senegalimassilia sp.]|uniref:sulfate/molybdate ABC transporter ATP-binding protein n=1 Tax=uncultured Senegalimassilia sp. TaxID=1714350 RepID=UPI002675D0DC|nr:ATP-binding cassette domain-containing protein [uncultured Senegalimassilia sp.]